MAGRFVRGGVQHNLLEQREEEAKKRLYGDTPKSKDDATSSATGWGTGGPAANVGREGGSMMAAANSTTANQESATSQKSGGQYSVEKTYGKDDTLNKYQEKLAEASVRLTMKATAKIIKEAEERQRERNNQWMDRSRYNEEQAQRRYEQYGFDSYNQMKNFEQYDSKDGYITHPKTGFRYKPRKFDDKMNHTESRGWLHCWTQIMDFDAPEYQVVQSGKAPRQTFEATLTVKTRRGEIIDCQPTYTAKSKKAACTEVAWMFIEQMVERGLLQKDKVPDRSESEQLTSQSGINSHDVKSIDLTPEARQAGGNWNLAQAIHRFHTFCQLIKCPMDIKLNAYGPDHDRKTDAHCMIKFQIIGEEEQRVYSASHTCQNKKQAQAAAALTMVRQLYVDGFIEGFRKPMKMPPRVVYSKSEGTADQSPMDEDEKKITGGWVLANSMNALTVILKRWNIDPNFWCEPRGKPSKWTFIMFISELRWSLLLLINHVYQSF